MSNGQRIISSVMQNALLNRFESDLIDWNDKEGTIFDAEVVVRDLFYRGLITDEIVRPLKEALSNWGPEIIDEFSDATNTDWSFDAESTEWLEAIIRRMIEYAEQTSQNVKRGESI